MPLPVAHHVCDLPDLQLGLLRLQHGLNAWGIHHAGFTMSCALSASPLSSNAFPPMESLLFWGICAGLSATRSGAPSVRISSFRWSE
jgi:hypothetical protein